jgi:hypothetical protein
MLLIHTGMPCPLKRVDRAQDVDHVRASVLRRIKRGKIRSRNALSSALAAQILKSYGKGYPIEMVSTTPNFDRGSLAPWEGQEEKKSKMSLDLMDGAFPWNVLDAKNEVSGRDLEGGWPLLGNLIEILLEDEIWNAAFNFFFSPAMYYENSRS